MCVYPIFSGEIFRERNYQNVCLYGGKCIREWWLCELTDHLIKLVYMVGLRLRRSSFISRSCCCQNERADIANVFSHGIFWQDIAICTSKQHKSTSTRTITSKIVHLHTRTHTHTHAHTHTRTHAHTHTCTFADELLSAHRYARLSLAAYGSIAGRRGLQPSWALRVNWQ